MNLHGALIYSCTFHIQSHLFQLYLFSKFYHRNNLKDSRTLQFQRIFKRNPLQLFHKAYFVWRQNSATIDTDSLQNISNENNEGQIWKIFQWLEKETHQLVDCLSTLRIFLSRWVQSHAFWALRKNYICKTMSKDTFVSKS